MKWPGITLEEPRPAQASFAKFLVLPKGKMCQNCLVSDPTTILQSSDYKSTPTCYRQQSKFRIRHKTLSSGFLERRLYSVPQSKCMTNAPKYFTVETPSSLTLPTIESTSTSAN